MIGENIKKLCEIRRISQRELGKRANVTESSISRYVKGDRVPNARTLPRIADALGVTAGELLGEIKEMKMSVVPSHGFSPDEVIVELHNVIEWLDQHGRNTNAAGISVACNHAIDTIMALSTCNAENEANIKRKTARDIIAEVRTAYDKYGAAYGFKMALNGIAEKHGVKDCRDCRYFVGCECFSGQVCADFTDDRSAWSGKPDGK
jgi:transcriptional regulator with XRE-family HTH domain